jgi:hypothetical protein
LSTGSAPPPFIPLAWQARSGRFSERLQDGASPFRLTGHPKFVVSKGRVTDNGMVEIHATSDRRIY